MTDHEGPWGGVQTPPPPPPPPRPGHRRLIWLVALAAFAAGLWELSRLFPGQLAPSDWAQVWRLFGLLALVSSGVVYATGRQMRRGVRYAAIWAAIVVVLALAYTFRGDLLSVAMRVRGELVPAYAQTAAPHTLVVNQSEDGNFYIMGAVNGAPVRFLVDTGASDVVLSPADAARVGIDTAGLDYGHLYATANGTGRGASLTVDRLSVGPIAFAHAPLSINQAPMDASLLGMTFLARLDAFGVRDGRLYLRWKG